MKKKPIVALIYDFDGTLSPGNMQEFGFMDAIDYTPEQFWTNSDKIAENQDVSNILSYMKLMIDAARLKNMKLRKSVFRKFGTDIRLFNGVKEWFKIINDYGKKQGIKIEHYIISSGLKEIIEGSCIAKEFKHIFACTYIYDENGEAVWPGVAVDYTGKTQFMFKINKGIFSSRDTQKVNESMADEQKRIPFSNMIYIGDGDTDVPCMKLATMFGGHSIAVFHPGKQEKKENALKLHKQGRVSFCSPAVYTKESQIYKIVCTIIDKIKSDSELKYFSKKTIRANGNLK